MASKHPSIEERELLRDYHRRSGSSEFFYELDDRDLEERTIIERSPRWSRFPRWAPSWLSKPVKRPDLHLGESCAYTCTPRARTRRWILRRIAWAMVILPLLIVTLVASTMICLPSYTHAPAHYDILRQRTLNSNTTGSANINNEKVFIAASIYDKDGELTGGLWGKAVLRLVDILGPENVFLSIYENNPDSLAATSLKELGRNVRSNSSIIAEHVALDEIPHITLPTGGQRLKRIEFLADVRNRALRPLDNANSPAYHTCFDKLLYLNDVIFDPIDAANLLFSTNVDSTGQTQYRAACAVDFGNAFKFYDTFATRDLEGHSMGIPFFPWFTNEGNADSRQDVLDQKDAVRVRSCWGGMIAFEAKWFQTAHPSPQSQVDNAFMEQHASNMTRYSSASILSPAIRFRAEEDLYWESSECCLIHADIQPPHNPLNVSAETGIYMNPYIRVAYDPTTYWWLSLTRRPERLYPMIHRILNPLVGLPRPNPRRTEEPGQEVIDKSWVYSDPNWETTGNLTGGYREVNRIAKPGGFCGSRQLLLLNEHAREGEPRWESVPVPTPP
ncbi:cryptococcal mannosyltransferase 1-domain-containing protein [Cryomyces antarcticus]